MFLNKMDKTRYKVHKGVCVVCVKDDESAGLGWERMLKLNCMQL